jgi:HIV-1 Vpr-binding protein
VLLKVWKSENNGDAVVLAAEKAATTVVDAAISTSVSR